MIPCLETPPGEGNGKPLQYSYLGNPRDRGAWQATVHGSCWKLDEEVNIKKAPTFRILHYAFQFYFHVDFIMVLYQLISNVL